MNNGIKHTLMFNDLVPSPVLSAILRYNFNPKTMNPTPINNDIPAIKVAYTIEIACLISLPVVSMEAGIRPPHIPSWLIDDGEN